MKAPWYPWSQRYALSGRPTVGWLMDLCDENYRHLEKLAPKLRSLNGAHLSTVDGVSLCLEVLEQTPYTTFARLTYYFDSAGSRCSDPDAVLRIYHDARQIEVIDLMQSALPLDKKIHCSALNQKWKANLFLSKWLLYCIRQGHDFNYHVSGNVYST